MRTIIIEDEKPAAEKLQKAIQNNQIGVEVAAVLNSIESATHWLQNNPLPDLIFMDIELSDGLSFKIFEKGTITCPVIFTTAYDEYWQEAFEHNSLDYLLKPIRQEKLDAALNKYDKLKQYFAQNLQSLLAGNHQSGNSGYKKRFLVKQGSDYVIIKIEDIGYFYATHKLVCLVDQKNRKYILDQSLAEIEKQLDPAQFYRVNRKYLVQLSAIRKIKTYPKSKLLLEVEPVISDEIIISQENVAAFKEWMGQ